MIYSLLTHEKHVILLEGTHLTFIVNRSVEASQLATTANSPTNTN